MTNPLYPENQRPTGSMTGVSARPRVVTPGLAAALPALPLPEYPVALQEYDLAMALDRAIRAKGRWGRANTIWSGSNLLAIVRRDSEVCDRPDSSGICHAATLKRDSWHALIKGLIPSEEGRRGEIQYRTAGLKAAAKRGGSLWHFLKAGAADYKVERVRFRRDYAWYRGDTALVEMFEEELARLEVYDVPLPEVTELPETGREKSTIPAPDILYRCLKRDIRGIKR